MANEFENLTDRLRNQGKCCITGEPLKDSKILHIIQLNIPAQWNFPVWGNILAGVSRMAVAYVHDRAIKIGKTIGPVRWMVEFSGEEILYHEIPRCRVCGCTDEDCRECIQKTGHPCHWVEQDLCSACQDHANKTSVTK